MEPKRGQTVKVMYTGATALPKDRESVYWFNVLEVPPKPKDAQADKNLLQLAFRTRIKLFIARAVCRVNLLKRQQNHLEVEQHAIAGE